MLHHFWQLPVYLGEFSCVNWAPGDAAARYVADSIEMFEGLGWSWAYHAWRSWPGWDAEAVPHGRGTHRRSHDAPLVSVLRRALARQRPPR